MGSKPFQVTMHKGSDLSLDSRIIRSRLFPQKHFSIVKYETSNLEI
jgi:hypothetical protein